MAEISAFTEGDAVDTALCKRVADVLQRYYPEHPWMVGITERQAGVVVIDLPFKPPSLRNYAYLLHLKNCWDDAAIMRAGGEWLERVGLARERAKAWAAQAAKQHGLDVSGSVEKSRH